MESFFSMSKDIGNHENENEPKKGIRHPWNFPSNGIVTYLPNQAFIPEDKVDLYGFGKNTENINVSFN